MCPCNYASNNDVDDDDDSADNVDVVLLMSG